MTIYALSSGPGLSGIAVIRVSGPDTLKVLKNMTYLTIPDPKVASLRKFINPNYLRGGRESSKKACSR